MGEATPRANELAACTEHIERWRTERQAAGWEVVRQEREEERKRFQVLQGGKGTSEEEEP